MADRSLDEVAERLAQGPITFAQAVDRLEVRAEQVVRLPRPISNVAGTVTGLWTLRRVIWSAARTPDRAEAVRLYREILAVDRDRAEADIAAVEARLGLFLDAPDALVLGTARWLVRWVAANRPPSGPEHAAVEDKVRALTDSYRDVVGLAKERDPDVQETIFGLSEEYETAWARLLVATG